MRLGFYQFEPKFHDPEHNLARIETALGRARADLVVLPELCTTGYLLRDRAELERYAEEVPSGPTCRRLAAVCARRNLAVVAGLAERAGSRIFNSAVLFTPEGRVNTYRKSHLFLDEKDIFDPGDTGFPVFEVGSVKVGMLVCFDYIFPEPARSLALAGCQVVCHPANLVLDYAQWMTLTRSAENRVFWVLANRTGTETLGDRTLAFTGLSQIVEPRGRLLYRAGMDSEELPVIDIEPERALDKLATPRNHLLDDRRTDLYRL
ncbi:acyltransferase [candidate division WOR-3 bacterium]|nr:acyltransferase [candidate division WOR-3 bacterium]